MNGSHAFKTCVLSVVVFNYRRILSTYDIHVRDENASVLETVK